MLLRRMRLRSAVVSRQTPPCPPTEGRVVCAWYSAGVRPVAHFSGSLATYQSRCQSSRYWYAPRRNEPEPQAGSRIFSFDTDFGFRGLTTLISPFVKGDFTTPLPPLLRGIFLCSSLCNPQSRSFPTVFFTM